MFQNIQQLAQKGTYETVCQGTSANVICYMAQRRIRGHNMETNQVQITTMLQFHVQRRSSLNSGP